MDTTTRFRHIYTVTRQLGKMKLGEAVEEMRDVLDKTDEFLYRDEGESENIGVRLEMWDKDNKRWMEVKVT